ncbi:hypothetical protein NQZ68_020793 [Dissostichus eleginoides]|nr:hypothetical protein NQZ68_020793 [Dissostichus eleginoides]
MIVVVAAAQEMALNVRVKETESGSFDKSSENGIGSLSETYSKQLTIGLPVSSGATVMTNDVLLSIAEPSAESSIPTSPGSPLFHHCSAHI